MNNAVKVVGLGAVCANGLTKEDFFDSVIKSVSSVDGDGFSSLSDSQWQTLTQKSSPHLNVSKCLLLAAHSLQASLQESGWTKSELAETGFIMASTTSQIDQWEKHLPFYQQDSYDSQKIKASVAHQSLGAPLIHLSESFGIGGPRALITSSCSASLHALAMAFHWIRAKKVRRCIVGATEIHSTLTRVGFSSLRLLSKTPCRPFDKNRTGINLGEGSAFLCLEAEDLQRESTMNWGFLTGAGMSTDAYHSTSPHPEGLGSQMAMNMALTSAKLTPEKIDWIYAHGTGSPANDLAEAKAILQIFGPRPFVSSTKSNHAHTLAASGALESVIGLMAMKQNIILPTFNYQEPDTQISLKISNQNTNFQIEHLLKNSLGFGGMNASVIFSKQKRPS